MPNQPWFFVFSRLGPQLWKLKFLIVQVWLAPLLILGLVLLARLRWKIPVLDLTGDPIMLTDSPLYLGAVSYLGVLLWCATAVVGLLAAQLLASPATATVRGCLRTAGWLSLVLCLDDLYLLHEEVFPRFLGVPQTAVLAAYGVAASGYLWRYRRVLIESEFALLALALTMFAGSVAVDLIATGERHFYLAEDGAKLMGIVMWLVFHTRMAMQALRGEHPAATTVPAARTPS